MNNFDYTNLTTRELLEKALNGEIPIPRNNPQLGQSKYFFMKTGSDPYASINDAEIFDVPDDTDPFEFRDNGYQMPVVNTWDSALTDTSTSALTSSLEDTSLNSFSNSTSYLSALNPLQQNTNSYLSALTPLQQNSNSYLSTQNTLPQNNSLIDLLKQMFPLKTGDETTDLSSTQTPTDLMTNYLSTPLHQGVQNGLNSVFDSTPSYASKLSLPSHLDIRPDIDNHFEGLKYLEGNSTNIYFDTKGLPTIGIGKLITNAQIDNDLIWKLNDQQKADLKSSLQNVSKYFDPMEGALRNLTKNKQEEIFDNLSKGYDVASATKGRLSYLPDEDLQAFKTLYNDYSISDDRMRELVYEHYEKIHPQITNFLEKFGINWNNLKPSQRSIVLDIAYNGGGPLVDWKNLANAIRENDVNKTARETHRIGVGERRNNYLLLMGLPEYQNAPHGRLKNAVEQLNNIELTKDNFDQYYHIHKVGTNPFLGY